jgi:hypothetical protein
MTPIQEVAMAIVYHRPHTTDILPPGERDSVWIEPWPDPLVDRLGVPICGGHTERFWLPVLGPTATWLMRYLDAQLDEHPTGVDLHLATTAQALGVSTTTGSHGPVAKALNRCALFGLVQAVGDGVVVRRSMPPLPARYSNRLPVGLRAAHRQWINDLHASRRGGSRRR